MQDILLTFLLITFLYWFFNIRRGDKKCIILNNNCTEMICNKYECNDIICNK